MTTHERITEAIMENGWTAEEATLIKDEFIKVKAIIIDKVNGGWSYTSSVFAEKETQELALYFVQNPIEGV